MNAFREDCTKLPRELGEFGIVILEILVSLVVISVAMMGTFSLFKSIFQTNANSRTDLGLLVDMEAEVDEYRDQDYREFINSVWGPEVEISDGSKVTLFRESVIYKTPIETSFTAHVKGGSEIPDVVYVRVEAKKSLGIFGEKLVVLESYVANAE